MKRVANRRGTDIRLYRYSDGALFMRIPFGRVTSTETTASRVWARGGVSDANIVGFDDPVEGTLTITTEIIPIEILALACSPDGVQEGGEWATREELAATGGKITLTETPIAGSLFVYKKDSDAEGDPVATTSTDKDVTLGEATEGEIYVAYYLKEVSEAKKVTLSNRVTPGSYIVYADTTYKADDDTIVAEQIKYYKAMPQKAISLTYQGSGDPASMDLVFDLAEDDDGNVMDITRM